MTNQVPHIVVDTQILLRAGLGITDPDVRKLLMLSGQGRIRFSIPYLVWEERRTQLLETASEKFKRLQETFDSVRTHIASSIAMKDVLPPKLITTTLAELDAKSIEAMNAFAVEFKLDIRPIEDDHAHRSWKRYFSSGLPFNPREARQDRRKDIPDAWIFESILDMHRTSPDLVALCDDNKMIGALEDAGITVFRSAKDYLTKLEEDQATTAAGNQPPAIEKAATPVAAPGPAVEIRDGTELENILNRKNREFMAFEAKVLGFIGVLGSTERPELYKLLLKSGLNSIVVDNVIQKLILVGLIVEVGEVLLPKDSHVTTLAAQSVEAEVIALMGDTH